MTEKFILPIVGMHFRPPAKAILANLPGGAELLLEPEPENPYDPNAVKVSVRSAQIPPGRAEALDQNATPMGYTAAQIFQQPVWHLGYIPRESAQELHARIVASQNPGHDDEGKLTVEPLPGRLSFDTKGKPQVSFELDEGGALDGVEDEDDSWGED